MTKRICIYSNHYSPEQFKLNDISCELVKQGYDIKVISQTPNYPLGHFFDGYGWFKRRKERLGEHLEVRRLPVIPRGNNSVVLILNYFSYIWSSFFYSLFTRDQADAVLIYITSPIFVAWAGIRFARRRKIPVTLYLLDLWPGNLFAMLNIKNQLIRNFFTKLCIRIYKRVDRIYVSSYSFKEVLVSYGIDDECIHYLPQHAEFDDKHWRRPDCNGVLKVIFAGNIGQAQGLDILVGCAEKLKRNGIQNVHFTLLGDGRYKHTLLGNIESKDVNSYFTFVDPVPRERVIDYLNQHDLGFVSLVNDPVISKTLPAKVQSYMAVGMPILASGDGETKRTIEYAQCGFCSVAEDIDDLVSTLQRCLNIKPEVLEEMGKNGYNYSRANFDLIALTEVLGRGIIKGE